ISGSAAIYLTQKTLSLLSRTASGFAHTVSVIAAAPGNSAHHLASHSDISVFARDPVFFGYYTEFASAVINLVNPCAYGSVRADHLSSNGHFLVIIPPRIVTDVTN